MGTEIYILTCSSCCCNFVTECEMFATCYLTCQQEIANNTPSSVSCLIFRSLSYTKAQLTLRYDVINVLYFKVFTFGCLVHQLSKQLQKLNSGQPALDNSEIMLTYSLAAFSCFCSLTYTLMWRSRKVSGSIGETCNSKE